MENMEEKKILCEKCNKSFPETFYGLQQWVDKSAPDVIICPYGHAQEVEDNC